MMSFSEYCIVYANYREITLLRGDAVELHVGPAAAVPAAAAAERDPL